MKSDKSYQPGSGRITEAGKMRSASGMAKPSTDMKSSTPAGKPMSSKPASNKPFPGAAKQFTSKDAVAASHGGKAKR